MRSEPPPFDRDVPATRAGRYRLEEVIGEGGMGRVYAARDPAGNRVAVKMLRGKFTDDARTVARFLQEARTAGQLKSEHVARLYEAGFTSDGAPFIAMELLEGKDLATLLQTSGKLPVARAVDWVLEAAEGLAEAHALRIVHRDLKPSNLFLAGRESAPCVKILDFGIAKSLDADDASLRLTSTKALLGSPLYMSAEQLKNARTVDHRTDIWSLGVVLFELVTGKVPFDGDSLAELSVRILSGGPPPQAEEIPDGLYRAIVTCLHIAPAARFASLAELAAAIAPFGSPRARQSADVITARIASAPVPDGSERASDPSLSLAAAPPARLPPSIEASRVSDPAVAVTLRDDSDGVPTRSRGRRWLFVTSPLLVAMVVVGTWGALRHRVRPTPAPATPASAPEPALSEAPIASSVPVVPPAEPTSEPSSLALPVRQPKVARPSARPTASPPAAKPRPAKSAKDLFGGEE